MIKKKFLMGGKARQSFDKPYLSCKTEMAYCSLKPDGDKPQMYKELTEPMGEIYQDVNVKIFGPLNVTDFSSKENTKVT